MCDDDNAYEFNRILSRDILTCAIDNNIANIVRM